LSASGVNYCSFRGLLMASYIYFKGRIGFTFGKQSARIIIGNHIRSSVYRDLAIGRPLFAGFFPQTSGILDDHFECWFESFAAPPVTKPEGFESVIDLPLSEAWLPPPGAGDADSPTASSRDEVTVQ
jgi:hypothetical protein